MSSLKASNPALLSDLGYLQTYRQPGKPFLYCYWQGHPSTEQVVAGAEEILRLLAAQQTHRILNDNSAQQGTWSGALSYISGEWLPRAVCYGLEAFAHVLSPDPFAQLSASQMQIQLELNLKIKLFSDVAAAESWLVTV